MGDDMNMIKIFDTTLRDGEQSPGCTMHHDEKIKFALKLERLGVDIIEAGFPVTSDDDMNAVKAISTLVKDSQVCALARATYGDVDAAYESIRLAAAPRLHIFIATSEIHMRAKLKMTEEQVIERIASTANRAKRYLSDIQFSFEDATRSNTDFLVRAIETAQKSGVKAINIADTVGYSSPEEIAALIQLIQSRVDLSDIEFGVHCHNDLGMAVANSLSAIRAGANHIEGTINGIGERGGNASLEEIVMALHAKPEYNATTRIKTTEIYSTSRLLSSITGLQIPPNKPVVGNNAFLHESGIHQHGVLSDRSTYEIITPESIGVPKQEIVLGKHSGKHAFEQFLKDYHIDYSIVLLDKYFNDFKNLCDKKKLITALDIEALIAGNSRGADEQKYSLKNFLIATKKDGAFATVTLIADDKEIAYQADGNGAIDSSFTAINKAVGVNYRLIDFSLHAITGGEDALGEAIVKITDGETTMMGKGLSTDIVEASILAYLSACNKLLEYNNNACAKTE